MLCEWPIGLFKRSYRRRKVVTNGRISFETPKFERTIWVFGIELFRSRRRTVTLRQERYIERLVSNNQMQDARYVDSLMSPSTNLHILSRPLDEEEYREYRSIIAGQLYIAVKTRTDNLVAASALGTLLQSPARLRFTRIKTVLRYLNGTECVAFNLTRRHSNQLHAYENPSRCEETGSDWRVNLLRQPSIEMQCCSPKSHKRMQSRYVPPKRNASHRLFTAIWLYGWDWCWTESVLNKWAGLCTKTVMEASNDPGKKQQRIMGKENVLI